MAAAVRLGLIGVGPWGRVCLRTILALAPDVRLAGVVSRNPEIVDLVDCPVFTDWQELLASGLCDGVVVATPPASHAAITIAALERQVAVFVEKPLTLRPDQAKAVEAAALASGVPVMVDHIHLFSPAFRKLCQLASCLGPIRSISARAGKPGIGRPDASVLWDWGAHDVAMTLAVTGREPDHVEAAVVSRPRFDDGLGEIIDVRMEIASIPVTLRLGTLEQRARMFRVECRDGTLVYDDLGVDKLTLDGEAVTVGAGAPLDIALREFAVNVRSGVLDRSELALAVRVVDILACAERALR